MDLPSDAEVVRRTQQRALADAASAAPAVVGQVWSAVARRNWWAAAGWCLRGVDIVLLDLGRVQDASNDRDTIRQFEQRPPGARTWSPAHVGAIASAAAHAGVWSANRWRFRREFPHPRGGLWSMLRRDLRGRRGALFAATMIAGVAARALTPPAVRPTP